jgi:hypothetical protein
VAEPICKPPPKWDGPPEDGLLRAVNYYRTGFCWTMIEARDTDYVEAVREDIERG